MNLLICMILLISNAVVYQSIDALLNYLNYLINSFYAL